MTRLPVEVDGREIHGLEKAAWLTCLVITAPVWLMVGLVIAAAVAVWVLGAMLLAGIEWLMPRTPR